MSMLGFQMLCDNVILPVKTENIMSQYCKPALFSKHLQPTCTLYSWEMKVCLYKCALCLGLIQDHLLLKTAHKFDIVVCSLS